MRFCHLGYVFFFFVFNITYSYDLNNLVLANYSISVTASNSSDYTLSGKDSNGDVSGNDPDLTFYVGDQVTFSVNASGHPFYLKTAAGTGTGNLISGVSNNGATNGNVVWTPQSAGTYYYQCSLHSGMVGTITIKNISQSTFTNAGGDNLWSNAANWSAGIPNVDTAKVTVDADLIVDSNKTVGQIKNNNSTSAASVTITATNNSVLTITGSGVTQPIQNNKSGGSFVFNLPVVFDSSDNATETLRFNSGADQSITFSSSLTLNDPLTVSGVNKNHDLNLDGSLLGSANLILGAKTQANFGASYNGSSYAGTLTTAGGGGNTNNQVTIISNVSDDGTFLKSGGLLNVTKDGAKITVNGANTLKGNIAVGDYNPTLTVNKNQSAVGTITMGSGTLSLSLATAVTSVAFADNSSSDWGTGSLVITDAANNEVSFGTDANGLTESQLAKISLNGYIVIINSSGQLSTVSLFNLPANNFRVEVGSATCIGNSDGVINLSVEDSSYDYTVTITGKDNVTITGDSKTASVTGLAKGTYTVCFSVDGQDDYEQCFEVNVTEPPALSAFIDIDTDDRRASIVMSGSSTYNIEINGKKTTVGSDSFETSLSTGLNIIKVYTDLECQGYVEREVFISEDIHYYPNPTSNDVKVHVGGKDTKVKVSVFNASGALVYTKDQTIEDISRKTAIDLSRQIQGTYIVVMESETVRQTFKIIRE